MQFAKTTPEILAYKVLERTTDYEWVSWAIDMLRAGHDTEHLRILAGESAPFDQFYMLELTDRVLKEVGIDYSDKDKILVGYIYYLVQLGIEGELAKMDVIDKIINIEDNLCADLKPSGFRVLFWAKDDLIYSDTQHYWEGANRNNIDEIITDYFRKWAAEHESKTASFDGYN